MRDMADPFGRIKNAEADAENGFQYPCSFYRHPMYGGFFGILDQLLNDILHPHFGRYRLIHICDWTAQRKEGG